MRRRLASAPKRLFGPGRGGPSLSRVRAAQVLVYCLRTLLALGHPLMPFVTERLWAALPAADEGAPRRPLISARWPEHAGAVDEAALAQYEVRPRLRPACQLPCCCWRGRVAALHTASLPSLACVSRK